MKRRDFLGAMAAAGVLPRIPRALVTRNAADYLLIPMDEAQADHLKAYGVTFRLLERGGRGEWLLNYRNGSFLLPADGGTQRDAALAGVTLQSVSAADADAIRAEIAQSNAEAVPLEKAPKVAVYQTPGAAPWDDAVTMALNYAGIKFDKVWDAEVMADKLPTYDWLHLHHEDFTGQYSKFYLTYAGAPWLREMVEVNTQMARQLGFANVPAAKKAVVDQRNSSPTARVRIWSMTPMNAATSSTVMRTTIVESLSSSRVGQLTFADSSRTSFTNSRIWSITDMN